MANEREKELLQLSKDIYSYFTQDTLPLAKKIIAMEQVFNDEEKGITREGSSDVKPPLLKFKSSDTVKTGNETMSESIPGQSTSQIPMSDDDLPF